MRLNLFEILFTLAFIYFAGRGVTDWVKCRLIGHKDPVRHMPPTPNNPPAVIDGGTLRGRNARNS